MSDDTPAHREARLPSGTYDGSWYDDEPITSQQLTALSDSVESGELPSYSRFVVRKALAEIGRLQGELRKCGELNRELVNEAADLQAQLAEIGETRQEYGYRYSSHSTGDGDPDETGYDDEATARRIAKHGDTIMRRRVGDWEVVPGCVR
jgi:hypothetical protein